MPRRTHAFALSSLVLVSLCHRTAAGGPMTTPLQTQSIPMTPTDWGPGTRGLVDPLPFQQFDPSLGTLTAVDLTLQMTIRNDFMSRFAPTPTPTTISVATTQTSDPRVLADPNRVQQLTDGPTFTLKGPDGLTPLFGAPRTTLPVDVVSLTEPAGTWSSMLPATDPHFIPPRHAQLSFARTLDTSSAASLLRQFIGSGTIDLPLMAIAYSSFSSHNGNGSGVVLTSASATVTLQYEYAPPPTPTDFTPAPEPSGLLVLGLGAGIRFLAAWRDRRAAGRARSNRD